MHLPFDLTGRVAIVTGASRGIGLAASRALSEAGASVAICARSKDSLEKIAKHLRNKGNNALPVVVDLADPTSIRAAVNTTLRQFKKIDILVNCAGILYRAPAAEWSLEDWNEVINVNLSGTFLFCQQVGRHMIERKKGGKIISIASIASSVGLPDIVAYSSSKGGIVSLTKSLAFEWAGHGINVNAIAPGYIRTEMTQPLQDDKKKSDYIVSRIPLGRWGEPEDLNGIIVCLASAASDYITGQVIWVDGGWSAM